GVDAEVVNVHGAASGCTLFEARAQSALEGFECTVACDQGVASVAGQRCFQRAEQDGRDLVVPGCPKVDGQAVAREHDGESGTDLHGAVDAAGVALEGSSQFASSGQEPSQTATTDVAGQIKIRGSLLKGGLQVRDGAVGIDRA